MAANDNAAADGTTCSTAEAVREGRAPDEDWSYHLATGPISALILCGEP